MDSTQHAPAACSESKMEGDSAIHGALRERVIRSQSGSCTEQPLKACGLGFLYAPTTPYLPPKLQMSDKRAAGTYTPETPLEEAILCLLLSADTHPKRLSSDPGLVWHILLALSVGGAYSHAAGMLSKHFKSENGRAAQWLAKSHAHCSSAQPAKALQTVQTLHSLHPGSASIALHMAAMPRKAGVSAKDLKVAMAALNVEGNGLKRMAHVQAALAIEDEARRLDSDMEQALAHVKTALKYDPADFRVLYLQARLEALNNAAPSHIVQISQSAIKAGGVALGPIWAVLAIARAAQQFHDKAILALETGLMECGPTDATVLHTVKIHVYLHADEPAQALEALRQLMAHVQRGTAHTETIQGGAKQVLVDEEVKMWIQAVHVFLALKQYKDAQFCVDRALGLNRQCAEVHYVAGLLHQGMGEVDDAAASFETALAIDPRLCTAELRCGALYSRRGEPGDLVMARDLMMSGLRHQPDVSEGRHHMGTVNKLEDRYQEAEKELKQAVSSTLCPRQLVLLLPRYL